MPTDLLQSPLFFAAVILGAIGGLLVLGGVMALMRWKLVSFAMRTLVGLLLISLGTLSGTVAIGIQGYRALTREDVAARIVVQPAGAQRFVATFSFPDGRKEKFELSGDEIYVDAHILKWNPHANLIGLHTAYELDRVAGRYHSVKEEREAPRTVHSLGRDRPVDLYALHLPRAAARRGIRLGDVYPGDNNRRARAARLHHRPAAASNQTRQELEWTGLTRFTGLKPNPETGTRCRCVSDLILLILLILSIYGVDGF
jgi:hypothetical protein